MKTKFKGISKYTGAFAASLVISRLVLCGVCMPSSAALCAALPLNGLGYTGIVGALLGTVSLGSTPDSIRMFCCCLIILGVRVVLDNLDINTPLYQPLLCLSVVMSTGIVSLNRPGDSSNYIILFVSTAVFSLFTAAVRMILSDRESRLYKPSMVFFLAVLAVSAVKFELLGVSLGRVLVLIVIPVCASLFGSSVSILVSAMCGAAFSFTGMTAYAALLPIESAIYCILSKKNKWLATTVYFSLFAFVSCMLDRQRAVITVCEAVSAYLIFRFAPRDKLCFIKTSVEKLFPTKSVPEAYGVPFSDIIREKAEQIKGMLCERLELCGGVMPSKAVDIDGLSDAVCTRVCISCRKKEECWVNNYGESTDALIKAAEHLKNGTAMTPLLLDGRLYGSCVKSAAFCTELNKAYIQQTGIKSDPYSVFVNILECIADTQSADTQSLKAASQLNAFLSENGKNVRVTAAKCGSEHISYCVRGEGLEVEAESIKSFLGGATGKEYECFFEEETAVFLEKPVASATIGEASRKKTGESISGDRVESFVTEYGKFVVIISDGMGSGDVAAAYSSFVTNNLKKLMRSGTPVDTAVKLVDGILSCAEGDFFATADILVLDLYTLEAELVKAGAALSVLHRKNKFFTVSTGAMPLGIDGEKPKKTVVRLKDGDMLMLFTDGVVECDENCAALTAIADSYDKKTGQALPSFIISQLADVSRDDMSVVCVEVHK